MKILMIVLRVLGVIAGAFLILVGAVGFSTGEMRGLAVALIVMGCTLAGFSVYRSPVARAEAKAKKEAETSARMAAVERARAEAARQAREAAEERQREEELNRKQREAQEVAWKEQDEARRAANREQAHTASGAAYRQEAGVRFHPEASRGQPVCPRCGSTALSGGRRGYAFGRGIFWALLLGVGGYYIFSQYWNRAFISFVNVFGDDARRYLGWITRQKASWIALALGALLGLRIGSVGSSRVKTVCLSCGAEFDPAFRYFVDELKQSGNRQSAPEPDSQPRRDWDDPPIPPGFADYLREIGQDDPRYSGRNNALECVLIDMADDKERAVMWAYAVDCARHSRTMGNILHAPDYFKYRAFGEYASRHGDVLASVADRRAYEYWSPTTTTKAYRAAREFLG